MKTENHTVTIPISDYNELLATKDLVGVTKLEDTTPMYQTIKEAMQHHQNSRSMTGSVQNSDIMKGVEIFIRIR